MGTISWIFDGIVIGLLAGWLPKKFGKKKDQ
jgi:uncharacterized membrane protein YeaQ/YmgE (transglycosylase-associated protein family)